MIKKIGYQPDIQALGRYPLVNKLWVPLVLARQLKNYMLL
ncbi:hypothetical protein PALB_3430 [Pseudoalteromonas luteoviolacea B = ATCC 29581]|nr:hypothetical protein PALB_3430 [Pseudoalteromonas luteoviolacea B = ATCC 29581]